MNYLMNFQDIEVMENLNVALPFADENFLNDPHSKSFFSHSNMYKL